MSSDRHSVQSISHERNQVLQRYISNLRVRDKRLIFIYMEQHNSLSHNTFFPHYGFRAGEFAVNYILGDNTQKSRRLKRKTNKLLAVQRGFESTSSSMRPPATNA
jgi:hypothetical protein